MLLLVCGLGVGQAVTAAPAAPVLLVLGDSLSAGYGLRRGEDWPSLLQTQLARLGYPQQVVNASVSGETSSGGVTRLPALLEAHQPQGVVIELGANDGLRGLPLTDLAQNLGQLIERSRQAGAWVVLVPMRVPPNYGPLYAQGFDAIYTQLAAKGAGVSLTPFLLEKVALEPRLLQADGLHPTASAQPLLLDTLWPTLKAALDGSTRKTP